MLTKAHKSTVPYLIIPLLLLVTMVLGCGGITIEEEGGSVPTATASPAVTTPPIVTTATEPTANPVPTPAVVLECPSNQRVELSVLVEPLDTGNVEIAGSAILTNGGATPVCKDDQINITARPNEGWRFDH